MKNTVRLFVVAVFIIACSAVISEAVVPRRINFQGKLLDKNKNPRNGTFDLTFSIWDSGPATSGGTMLWSETQSGVSVTNGVLSVQLGAVNPIYNTVFAGSTAYLQIQVDSEVSGARQRLMTTPYAFRARVADSLAAGSTEYIQNRATYQGDSSFYVSSGTIDTTLVVGGKIQAGASSVEITTEDGYLDAAMLEGAVPSANLSGTYAQKVTFSSNTNVFVGDGAGLKNVTAATLAAGSTNYVQIRNTLQSGATFYVSSATVQSGFSARGTVELGTAGGSTVTVRSDLSIGGDVRVNGNDLLDSAGTSRIKLGSQVAINGSVSAPSGQTGVFFSTSIVFVGSVNGDNYIAYPFTAATAIGDRDLVTISGANTVGTTTTSNDTSVLGIAVSSAGIGDTVYVALTGVVTGVVANGTITAGGANRICAAPSAGRVQTCSANNACVGRPLTGATAGQTLTVILWSGR